MESESESESEDKGETTNRARCGLRYRLVSVQFLSGLIASGSGVVCEGVAGMLPVDDLDGEDVDAGR